MEVRKEELVMTLDRFAVPLASEYPHNRPVAECLICGAEIYAGQEYLEIWPAINGRDVVCSTECARWAWHALEQEDRLFSRDESGWQIRVAEGVSPPWAD